MIPDYNIVPIRWKYYWATLNDIEAMIPIIIQYAGDYGFYECGGDELIPIQNVNLLKEVEDYE